MRQILLACLLVLGLFRPALAEWDSVKEYALDDPLARRIASTGTLEDRLLGPKGATVSAFSVPEPDGIGERLFVGLLDNPSNRGSRVQLWQGPVAVRWANLGPVPGYRPDITAPNPARYRIDRFTAMPGRGVQASAMEIDLESSPPLLWLLDSSSKQAKHISSQPLGESLLVNRSRWLLVRLGGQQVFKDGNLTLRTYEVYEGSTDPSRTGPRFVYPWNVDMDTHLLVVCKDGDPRKTSFNFMPLRPFGWKIEKLLAKPSSREGKGRFVLQTLAQYDFPDDTGELAFMASRHRVSVGLEGMSSAVMGTGFVYESMSESWITPAELRRRHAKLPPGGF